MNKIFVTYCSRTKSDLEYGKPEELYVSQRVKSFYKYSPGPNAILSYKYGIIHEDEIVDNYEQDYYTDNTIDLLKEKAKGSELIFWSPRPLTEGPWIKLLTEAKIDYRIIRSIKNVDMSKDCFRSSCKRAQQHQKHIDEIESIVRTYSNKTISQLHELTEIDKSVLSRALTRSDKIQSKKILTSSSVEYIYKMEVK